LSDLEIEGIKAAAKADSRRLVTILAVVIILGLASFGFTTYKSNQDFKHAREQLQATCLLRNENIKTIKRAFEVIAEDSTDAQTKRLLFEAASELQFVDCDDYS